MASGFLNEVMSRSAGSPPAVHLRPATGRAFYLLDTLCTTKNDGPDITAHEFGHHLEAQPHAHLRVREFAARRFSDGDRVNLAERFPGHGFRPDETGNPDNMLKVFGDDDSACYCGKTYSDGSTEILSMGLEQLYEDPVHFAQADPEYFGLVMGILQRGEKHT